MTLDHSKPVVTDFFHWCRDQLKQGGLLPSDPLTKALNYVPSREASLTLFLQNPDVLPDTKHLERALIDPRHPDRKKNSRRPPFMRIEDMSVDQLLELNQTICRRIYELQDRENLQALSQLRVGLSVTFEGRDGLILGILTKINRKSVIVLAEDGTKQYKVSPELLRHLRDVK